MGCATLDTHLDMQMEMVTAGADIRIWSSREVLGGDVNLEM